MMLVTGARKVETNIPGVVNNAMINANAQAFQVLSSNLYKDKISAIIRELSANALDAHKAAGNEDAPFTIVLPSALRPDFRVKDWGTGLDHNSILELYMTYFGSNKNGDNMLVGGLGLGSKTPFSYTDTFSVISRFNGMKSTYSAFKDEDGMPKIVLLEEKASDEHNGLEVIVPARAADFHEFKRRAVKALQYFPPKSFHIHGAEIPEIEYSLRTPLFGTQPYSWGRQKTSIVMGPVAYPVDWDSLPQGGLEIIKLMFQRASLDLFLPIGTVDIQASREALSYDRKSSAEILAVLQKVRESFIDIAVKNALDEPTPWLSAQNMTASLQSINVRIDKELGVAAVYEAARYLSDSGAHISRSVDWGYKRPKVTWAEDFSPRIAVVRNPIFLYLDGTSDAYIKFLDENRQWLKYYTVFVISDMPARRAIERIVGPGSIMNFSEVFIKTKPVRKSAVRKTEAGEFPIQRPYFRSSGFSLRSGYSSWGRQTVDVGTLDPALNTYIKLNGAQPQYTLKDAGNARIAARFGLLQGTQLIGIPRTARKFDSILEKRLDALTPFIFARLTEAWRSESFRREYYQAQIQHDFIDEKQRSFMRGNNSLFADLAGLFPESLIAKTWRAWLDIDQRPEGYARANLKEFKELFAAFPHSFGSPPVRQVNDVPFVALFDQAIRKYPVLTSYYLKDTWQQNFPLSAREIRHYFALLEES